MPHVGSEIDANFYQLIHKMLETPRARAGPERRSEDRRAYPTAHRIARWNGSKFPDENQFVPIQCHDLTRSGFSFLAAVAPDFKSLVVEFGTPPKALYVAAQVMHIAPVLCMPSGAVTRVTGRSPARQDNAPAGQGGKPMFLVGCRFTRRLRRPAP